MVPDRKAVLYFLDLLREILSLGTPHGKGLHQTAEIIQRYLARKQNAGEAGGVQQLREAPLCLPGFERDAIEQ